MKNKKDYIFKSPHYNFTKEIKYNNKIYKLKSLFEKNKDMKNIKLKNK